MLKRKGLFLGLIAVLVAGFALGGEAIPNWTAPATWIPSKSAGLHTLTDVTAPLPFVGITPCRVADTRGNGFTGQYGPPSLVANANRNFTIAGQCGIPSGASAVSFNFAALNVGGGGDLRVFPAGGSTPLVSTLNYNASTPNIANAAVVPLGTGGAITVRADAVPVDLIIDVNGYYSRVLNSSNYFALDTNSDGRTMLLRNLSTTCFLDCGLRQETYSNVSNTAISGLTFGTSGQNFGVAGYVYSNSNNAVGVLGQAQATSGQVYGVYGRVFTTDVLGAGVYGTADQALANGGSFHNPGADNTDIYLATRVLGVDHGVVTNGRIRAASLDIFGSPKNFVAPHPLDPSKEIKYASVEAPTVDVYFRGTGTLSNGYARIEVPDHFRYTAREGTYMTTLTPVGGPVSLSVESEGPEGIVVRGGGNGSFHYVVYAERAEIEGYEPVQPNVTFVPEFMEKVHMLKALPRTTKSLLVRNGTLNVDGTYNEATARAMGWVIPEPISQAQIQK